MEEIKKIADEVWEGCDGCEPSDEDMWKKGFLDGYLRAIRHNDEYRVLRLEDISRRGRIFESIIRRNDERRLEE